MAVCSILYQLATRQAEQEKIYQELCTVFADPSTPVTYQTLEQCHYLKAFIKEVFRLNSVKYSIAFSIQNWQASIISNKIYFPTEFTARLSVMVAHYKKTPLSAAITFRKAYRWCFRRS